AAYSRGEDKQTGQPVNTVDPMRMVVGLAYQPTTVWNAQLILTVVDRQDRIDSTAAAVEFFETPGYATLDLLGEYNFSDKASLNVGIFNLTDRKYWEWGDVVGREFDDVALNRFTRPGINASVSLRYEL
ncbi:MAG: hemoglobin/transferrin/lactoferrin receptor protein, partial [Pseudohongiellaceae bacterium]